MVERGKPFPDVYLYACEKDSERTAGLCGGGGFSKRNPGGVWRRMSCGDGAGFDAAGRGEPEPDREKGSIYPGYSRSCPGNQQRKIAIREVKMGIFRIIRGDIPQCKVDAIVNCGKSVPLRGRRCGRRYPFGGRAGTSGGVQETWRMHTWRGEDYGGFSPSCQICDSYAWTGLSGRNKG